MLITFFYISCRTDREFEKTSYEKHLNWCNSLIRVLSRYNNLAVQEPSTDSLSPTSSIGEFVCESGDCTQTLYFESIDKLGQINICACITLGMGNVRQSYRSLDQGFSKQESWPPLPSHCPRNGGSCRLKIIVCQFYFVYNYYTQSKVPKSSDICPQNNSGIHHCTSSILILKWLLINVCHQFLWNLYSTS